MSEYAESRLEESQSLNLDLLLGKRKLDESSSCQNSVWKADWNKNKRLLAWSSDSKTRVREQVIIGMNHHTGTANSKLIRTSSEKKIDLSFRSHQILKCHESSESKWGDFPMYGIKQKIESLLNPKRKGKAIYDDKVSELNFTYQESKEYRFETQIVATQNNNSGTFQNPDCSGTQEHNVLSDSQFKCPVLSINSIDNQKPRSNLGDGSGERKKSVAFFEMVTLPSKSFQMRCERKSKGFVENLENEITDGELFRKDKGLFSKSGTLILDSPTVSGSIGGLSSLGAKKVKTVRRSSISNSIAEPLKKDKEIIKSPKFNHTHGPSKTITANSTQIQTLSHPNSNSEHKSSYLSPETSNNTWLKRLRQNDQNNTSNTTSIQEANKIKIQNDNTNNQSGVSDLSIKSWIQRWTVAKDVPSKKNQISSPKEDQEELHGKQFPSIHALAMMGKAMNKFRPCEFQRRGPSVVWNSNES